MEEKLINAKELLCDYCRPCSLRSGSNQEECPERNNCDVYNTVNNAKAINIDSKRRGRWINHGDYSKCSNCDGSSGSQSDGLEIVPRETRFCPHCGAEMVNSNEKQKQETLEEQEVRLIDANALKAEFCAMLFPRSRVDVLKTIDRAPTIASIIVRKGMKQNEKR
jgi:hypothetical protein